MNVEIKHPLRTQEARDETQRLSGGDGMRRELGGTLRARTERGRDPASAGGNSHP